MKYLVIVFFALVALAYASAYPSGIIGAPIAVGGIVAPAAVGVGVAPLGLGVRGLGHGAILG
ncbi:hypothetical protein ILUMI_26225 [Ignelater luminosus]|uniref:Uncharacterized protein n=1 Tax=Ignelater luminosus TaxID=2038154 RepID=A0A8K0C8W4_IGNLU|nr:hypothetical protein ILUMI_26225 [Ignelater luminosus]